MTITIKTDEEIHKMRIAGKLAADVLDMIGPHVVSGVTTEQLNTICHDYITQTQQAIPAPLNYRGFPKSICTSVNHQVCHGIPSNKKLKKGDIINIDITVIKDGYHGDTSKMFMVGKPTIRGKRLCDIAQKALYKGIKAVQPGCTIGDIGHAIQVFTEANHCSVVRDYCGHGIGQVFHEPPQIVHYGKPGTLETLLPGMTFTIEPMVNEGSYHIKLLKDNWTVTTKDHKLSAQWEHTLLMTEDGCEILTLREEEAGWENL